MLFVSKSQFDDFSFESNQCFPTCSNCTGPLIQDCNECFEPFELYANGVCDYKESIGKEA